MMQLQGLFLLPRRPEKAGHSAVTSTFQPAGEQGADVSKDIPMATPGCKTFSGLLGDFHADF